MLPYRALSKKVICFFILSFLTLPACRKSKAPIKRLFAERSKDTKIKKKIVIFTSIGGGAHLSAADAVKGYLGDSYDISMVAAFKELGKGLDPVFNITGGSQCGEDLFNYLNRNENMLSIRLLCEFGNLYLHLIGSRLTDLFTDYLILQQADAVISVVPVLNGALYRAAEKLNIPFAIIPPELDTTNYHNDIYKPTFKKFYYGLVLDDAKIREKIKLAHIPEEKIRILGFPARPAFLQSITHSKLSLKEEFGIPLDKPVVMIMMGGIGSCAMKRYAKKIAKMDIAMHVIFCLGRNEELATYIQSNIKFPKQISISLIKSTPRIRDIMEISDVLITKAGPTSICEALYANLPVIIDNTYKVMYTERLNIKFVVDNKFGEQLRFLHRLPSVLKKMLQNNEYHQTLKNNIAKFVFPDSSKNIKNLVEEMLA